MELYVEPKSEPESDSPMEDDEPIPAISDEPAPKLELNSPMEELLPLIEQLPPPPPPEEWKLYKPTGGRYCRDLLLFYKQQAATTRYLWWR